MTMDRLAVQDRGLMGRVMVEVIPVQDFKVIRVDMAIKAIRATKVVIINKEVSSNNNQDISIKPVVVKT